MSDELSNKAALVALQLAEATLEVLTRQFGPTLAGAVREEMLARADSFERMGGENEKEAAVAVRWICGHPFWDDLTGRRPNWTRFDPPKR